jgi:hypothetical protein
MSSRSRVSKGTGVIRASALAFTLVSATCIRVWAQDPLRAATATVTNAQPSEEELAAARALGNRGIDAFKAGDYATAANMLEKAYAVLKAPSLAYWLGMAQKEQGLLVQAGQRFVEATRLPTASWKDPVIQERAQKQAYDELTALAPNLQWLEIRIDGAEGPEVLVLMIDGIRLLTPATSIRWPVNPGKHGVEAQLGAKRAEKQVEVAATKTEDVRLALVAPEQPRNGVGVSQKSEGAVTPAASSESPAQEPSWLHRTHRKIGWITVGVGGVAVLTGAVVGAVALGQQSSLDSRCQDGRCNAARDASLSGDVDRHHTLKTISTVGIWGGLAIGAVGATVVLTAPRNRTTGVDARVAVAPGWVGLHGRFQ